MSITKFNSHHVFLWYNPHWFTDFHETMNHLNMTKVSFKFTVFTYIKSVQKFFEEIKLHDDVITECGVCPIYASKYHNFLQQMELESKLGTENKTCHDIDEPSLGGILEYSRSSLKQGKCGNFEGSIIPKWFKSKRSKIEFRRVFMSVQLDLGLNNLMGFIFYFVIPHFSSKDKDLYHSSCEVYFYQSEHYDFHLKGPTGWHYSMIELNSNGVFLWYDPLFCKLILQKLQRRGISNNDEELIFAFEFECGDILIKEWGFKFTDCLIRECGVHSINV